MVQRKSAGRIFHIVTSILPKIQVFWDVMCCGLVNISRCFEGMYYFLSRGQVIQFWPLDSVNNILRNISFIYQSTEHNNLKKKRISKIRPCFFIKIPVQRPICNCSSNVLYDGFHFHENTPNVLTGDNKKLYFPRWDFM
jgi:hypothetical protein